MIAVVADDLTGAAELGALGWRHGLVSEVCLDPGMPAAADLSVMDTNSRTMHPPAAARQAQTAAQWLTKQRPNWLFKKIDSVLRGSVLVEVEAMMRSLNLPRALLVPSNPNMGRTIRDSQYWIHGQPIHETDFRNDPQHPATTSNVLDMLRSTGGLPVSILRVGQRLPARGIFIGEASCPSHLAIWAQELRPDTLPAGAGEFFSAVLELNGYRRANGRAHDWIPCQKDLFVCGSASASTRRFISQSRERGLPVLAMPAISEGGAVTALKRWIELTNAALERHEKVIVAIDQPLISEPNLARQLGERLADLTEAVLNKGLVRRLYIEGGSTAALIVHRMGWRRMLVVGELAPGIASLKVEHESPCALTIKPGSYEWPKVILDLVYHGP